VVLQHDEGFIDCLLHSKPDSVNPTIENKVRIEPIIKITKKLVVRVE
jgi:hypothetical protein